MKKILVAAALLHGLAAAPALADTVQGKVTAFQDDLLVVSRTTESGQVEDVSVSVSKDMKLQDGRPVSELKAGENVSVVTETQMFSGLPKARSVEVSGASGAAGGPDARVSGEASDSEVTSHRVGWD